MISGAFLGFCDDNMLDDLLPILYTLVHVIGVTTNADILERGGPFKPRVKGAFRKSLESG